MKYVYAFVGTLAILSSTLNGRVIPITNQNDFNAIGANSIIMFTTPTCGPCQLIKPDYKAMSNNTMYSHISFYMIDLDPNKPQIYQQISPIAAKFNPRGYPTFILFKNGQEVDRLTVGESRFHEKVTAALTNAFSSRSTTEQASAPTSMKKGRRRYSKTKRRCKSCGDNCKCGDNCRCEK